MRYRFKRFDLDREIAKSKEKISKEVDRLYLNEISKINYWYFWKMHGIIIWDKD